MENKKDAKMQYEDNYLWISCTYVSIYFLSWQVTWCRSSTASGLRRIPATSWSLTESAPSFTEGSCDSWRTQTWLCAPTSLPPISTLSTSKHPHWALHTPTEVSRLHKPPTEVSLRCLVGHQYIRTSLTLAEMVPPAAGHIWEGSVPCPLSPTRPS